MIPSNAFTPTGVYSNFQQPYDRAYTPYHQVVLGGTAIGDGAAGRQVKNWTVDYTSGNILVGPEGGATALTLPAPGAISVSLAFDNNMGVVLAWMTTSGASLYYYNTITSAYTTRTFTGITSCRVCVDDARDFNSAGSDVIFGYTDGTHLRYRQQRDRYDVEYTVMATPKKLKRMAPSIANRLQFELR
jgi:hypothetical protein